MPFNDFAQELYNHILAMYNGNERLYTVDVDRDELWNTYLNAFPEGTNPVYRTNTEHDCTACRHFVKRFGAVVAIKHNVMISIWDFIPSDSTYAMVIKALANKIHLCKVQSVFLAVDPNFANHPTDLAEDGTRYYHMYTSVPPKFTLSKYRNISNTTAGAVSLLNSERAVFQRSLEEISKEAIDVTLDLISQNSLYKGAEWLNQLNRLQAEQQRYNQLDPALKELWLWETAAALGPAITKIRNHSIGVFLQDLTDGVPLEQALKRYEQIVAPTNYKRPKAVFTAKMREEAKKKAEELGFYPSLQRRHAVLEDITVPNTLFANKGAVKRMKSGDVFDALAPVDTALVNPKKFDGIAEIPIADFIDNVLPRAQSLEVLVENRLQPNFVSLIAPQDMSAPTMFKWDNPFSWAYTGNVTDSLMKELVKKAGGSVTGDLRFSLMWNDDSNEWDMNDLDAHCVLPNGYKIYFHCMNHSHSRGKLDVDNTYPSKGEPAVENITFPERQRMLEGDYVFAVHNYRHRGGRNGFKAQIEFDGVVHDFEYQQEVRQSQMVKVVVVNYTHAGGFKIVRSLGGTSAISSQTKWGIVTNTFVPVSIMMYSPNFWDGQTGVGHQHTFFMLDGCINDESPNGFYNEFLTEELMQHKRVFEALGGLMKVEAQDNQLSGIGFSMTKSNSVICRVTGAVDRVVKVMF